MIAESLLSAEIDALKEPKQDHFAPEDLYIGIINFCQRKHYPLTRERLYTLTKYVNNKISPAKLHELREKAEKLTKNDIPITD